MLTTTSPLGCCPLQHNSVHTHHFIPSSTTFSGPAQTAAAEYMSLETDDRCGSYDDVVIEGDDDVTFEAGGQFDFAYTEFDDGCSAREEPQNTHLLEGLVTSEHEKTRSIESTMSRRAAIHDSLMMPKWTNVIDVSVRSVRETSRQSLISGPSPSAVRGSVNLHDMTNCRQDTGPDGPVKLLHVKSHGTSECSKKTKPLNAPVHVRNTTDKTSTLNSETLVIARQGHKGATKPPFKIFCDIPSRCSSSRSPRAPTNALCSGSVNTLSTRGGGGKVAQKITSPLCSCGRRAKRQLVSNGGPNHGRGFFCCPVRRSASGGQVQKGCEFFKWESAVVKSSSLVTQLTVHSSSVSFCHFKSPRAVCPVQSSLQRKSFWTANKWNHACAKSFDRVNSVVDWFVF